MALYLLNNLNKQFYSRSLRCLRNMIHCNMLFTFVLKCATFIGFWIFVLSKDSSISQQNHVKIKNKNFNNHFKGFNNIFQVFLCYFQYNVELFTFSELFLDDNRSGLSYNRHSRCLFVQ